jgi:hypothetical protein
MALLRNFSILHQQDTCKDFKEALEEWVTRHALAIREEQSYLASLGYKGDIFSKIFKSARYYLAKMDLSFVGQQEPPEQPQKPQQPEERVTKTPRKTYTSISAELSAKIGEYLQLEEHYRLKPSEGFALFCQVYREDTIQEIKRLRREEPEADPDAEPEMDTATNQKNRQALLKIKKTFKNKLFMKKKSL